MQVNNYWFAGFHSADNEAIKDEILRDVAYPKSKILRIAYRNRDSSVKDAGPFLISEYCSSAGGAI